MNTLDIVTFPDAFLKKTTQPVANIDGEIQEGEILSENEGCLSVPDFRSDVKRSAAVLVEGYDRHEKELRFEAHDLLAIVLQHEIDHLNGVLFIDRISALKRQFYKRRVLKQMKKEA